MINFFVQPNTLAVSVKLPPATGGVTNSRYTFPPVKSLDGRMVISVEAYCSLDSNSDPLNNGYTVMPPSVFKAAFLTIYTASGLVPAAQPGKEAGLYYDRVPFFKLRSANNFSTDASFQNQPFVLRPTIINFQRSLVEFPTSVAIDDNVSACFIFTYLDLDDNGDRYWDYVRNQPRKP